MSGGLKKSGHTHFCTAIIGAGPAGLAAAVRLSRSGMNDFILIEREGMLGGILNQCIHNGFGLELFREDLTGPEFAARMKAELCGLTACCEAGVLAGLRTARRPEILIHTMVSRAERLEGGGFRLRISSAERGLLTVTAYTIITAAGCRERTRENIEIPGTRPAGIFTAGQAQNLINRRHYSPGSRVIIQGSGDIGLIMARRLTLEGIKVVAVLERLPYLSGLIRNKVQCLDHFGIPLHLGRQIIGIRGRERVESAATAALSQAGTPEPGTELDFDCDTILFAVGLIPELESVIPAGVNLPDRIKPEANAYFETNVPGLFAAGNCLHINDLADSAAAEGVKTAESVLRYLNSPEEFRSAAENTAGKLPYAEPAPKTDLNAEYFRKLEEENYLVCIVCPKGCLLRDGEFGCRRGEEYFRRTASPSGGFRQRIHTTVEVCREIVPAVSVEEIPVKSARHTIIKLKEEAAGLREFQDQITIKDAGCDFTFRLCTENRF